MNQTIPDMASSSGQDVQGREFRRGFKISVPTMPGIFAWGLVVGMAMVKSGLTVWQALGMTFLVYAGSAQLAALPLMAAGAPLWLIFFTALMVNLRFVIFAAALGPHFAGLPWRRRLRFGYLCGDLAMALFSLRFSDARSGGMAEKSGYYAGIVYPNWWAWQTGSVLGILLAARIPAEWGVEFAGTLAMLAVMIPLIANSAALAGVAVAGMAAVAGAGLPYRLGLVLALVLGMAAALSVDALAARRKAGRAQ